MNDVEEAVALDLEGRGYSVYNIEPECFLLNKADSPEEKSLMSALSDEIGDLTFRTGAPDLFVYDAEKVGSFEYNVKKAFFVEVKSSNDSLSMDQLEWISKRGEGKIQDVLVYVAQVGRRKIAYHKLNVNPEPIEVI